MRREHSRTVIIVAALIVWAALVYATWVLFWVTFWVLSLLGPDLRWMVGWITVALSVLDAYLVQDIVGDEYSGI